MTDPFDHLGNAARRTADRLGKLHLTPGRSIYEGNVLLESDSAGNLYRRPFARSPSHWRGRDPISTYAVLALLILMFAGFGVGFYMAVLAFGGN
jgi:hypothetical protein